MSIEAQLVSARAELDRAKAKAQQLVDAYDNPGATASAKRTYQKQIDEHYPVLETAERRVAVLEARKLIPPQQDWERVPAAGAWGAIARGQLYEEETYRPDQGAHAPRFFLDMVNQRDDPLAAERLQRHQRQAVDMLANVTSGDPGLTGIVPPAYLQDEWAAYPRASRPFADAIGSRPLVDYGQTVSVPRVTTGASVDTQQEAGNVSETDPDTDSLTVDVVTIAGQVDLSRQSLERSMPGADVVIFGDLMAAYDQKLDDQLINGGGSGGEHYGIINMTTYVVTYTESTPTAATALSYIFNAVSNVASNRYLNPEAILLHPRRGADFASTLSDTQPIYPLSSPSNRALGSSGGGFVDNIAGLTTILDANVPITQGAGTNQDIIAVVRPSDMLLFEQPVRQLRFESVLSATLEIRLQVYSYSAFIAHRWASSVSFVTGTGLVNPW